MKACSKPTEKRERSVFSTIFISVLVILAVEVTLLIGSIAVSRVPQQLDRNAEDILAKQVENRSSYLENFLVQAQNLGDMPNRINEKTEALLTSGQISKDTLGQSSASSEPLLEAIADDLVTQLRSSSVTGVFVVLNTCDLDARKTNGRLPGIYLRDLDPDAAASERNEDLMLSFAPAGIVKSMRITTDSCWQPALDYEELDDFVYQPFMTAYQDGGKLLMAQYGRWTTSPYVLPGDKREAIAYAQPLILPDGTVYGVVGVELLCSYLEEQLPLTELQNDGTGAYLLAVMTDEKRVGSIPLQPVTFSTQDRSLKSAQSIVMQDSSAAGTIVVNKTKYFVCAEPLTLYDRNAPFSNEHWLLLGMVPNSTLMIGDIIASGETLVQCLRYVTDYYRRQGAQLRNIVLFTIGGTQGIEILEKLTREIRTYWPDFEGFITVYYEGVFSCYEEGDKGVSGINRALIDFYWKGGIIAPAFRRETLSMQNPLFEKCTIYDGGARRYEIHEHIDEVLEFWNGILERADKIDKQALLEEKLGHALPISYEDWVRDCHYGKLDEKLTRWLYQQERGFVESLRGISLEQIALQRIEEFTSTLKKYIL